MDRTSPEIINEVEQILEQKLSSTFTQDYTQTGGIEAVVEVLNGVDRGTEKTILDAHEDKAASIINRLTSSLQVRPFDFARKADPEQILNFIQHEHPQTIALILSYLDPVQSGQILSELNQDAVSASVYKHLTDEEIERLTLEISNVRAVSPEKKDEIIQEFHETAIAQEYISQGGIHYAKQVLDKALVMKKRQKKLSDENSLKKWRKTSLKNSPNYCAAG
ncbi:hypothetical protein DT075_25215 [Bacillus licheniformis]|nr:hypothetical protein DT075_25215 [Bacillus licheniformis]